MAYGTVVWRAGALTALGLVVAGAFTAFGCGGGGASPSGNANQPGAARSTVIQHEPCSEGGHRVEGLDVTNDGKPDIKKVFDGTTEVCRITDLNHDGHPDLFEYFDASGQLRRREFDFDDNGVVNQIEVYDAGKIVRRELDTSNRGLIDTWDTFDPSTGKLVRRERDTTTDGRVDQWWTYEGERVTISVDRNGDGQPDPEGTIVLGPDGKPVAMPVDGGAAPVAAVTDGGAAAADAGAASAPPPPPPPSSEPASPLAISDAGVVGKPQRGGAKR